MSLANNQHLRISRLIRTGTCPGLWCCVCGYAIKKLNNAIKCKDNACQNMCHISCFGEEGEFSCDQTLTLRNKFGITVPVEFLPQDPAAVVSDESVNEDTVHSASTNTEDTEDDLSHLESGELIPIIRQLRVELARKNTILNFFETTSQDLSSTRDAVVKVLSLIDNIAATKSSLEDLQLKSVASSARPDKIDEDWERKINANSDLQAWWTSGKPRPLKACHLPQQSPTTCPRQEQSSQVTPRIQPNSAPPSQPQHKQQPKAPNKSTGPKERRPNININKRYTRADQLERGKQSTSTQHRPPYCRRCRTNEHSADNCQNIIKCDYCHRQGHRAQECHSRLNEERQAQFLRKLASEQAQNNAILIQSFSRQLSPPLPPQFQGYPVPGGWPTPAFYPANQQQLQGPWNHASNYENCRKPNNPFC